MGRPFIPMQSTLPYILLVDDDENNLFLLEELLASEGYKTQSALSGQQALDIAHNAQPDLILLDVMMPGMDGFEVCRQLRSNTSLSATPIIFLTALDDEESRLKGLEVTGDDYLTKPIRSRLLLGKVANVLKLHHLRSQQLETQANDRFQQQVAIALKANESLSEKFRLFVPDQFLERIAPGGVDSI
ncbi:MAG TPA: response regulator, partial [Elainellaceae cyanobacterium]